MEGAIHDDMWHLSIQVDTFNYVVCIARIFDGESRGDSRKHYPFGTINLSTFTTK